MAEFPHLGKQCSYTECKQLDFLPFTCDGCSALFCSAHRSKDSHSCSMENIKSAGGEYTGSKSIACSLEDCPNRELTPILCDRCQQYFCLSHRHAQDHRCPKLVDQLLVNNIGRTAQHVQHIIASKPLAQLKSCIDKKSSKTAAKVALMKMKMTSQGDCGCPLEDRVYFKVHPPSVSKKEIVTVFFSKNWSVGRTIDSLAERLQLRNNNNIQSAQKLRLFSANDGVILPTDCDIDALLQQQILYNGSMLILEYIDNDCDVLSDLSAYEGS